jgi:hypothetical protein
MVVVPLVVVTPLSLLLSHVGVNVLPPASSGSQWVLVFIIFIFSPVISFLFGRVISCYVPNTFTP